MAAGGSFFANHLGRGWQQEDRQLLRTERITHQLAIALAEPIWACHDAGIRDIAKAFMLQESVRGILIWDTKPGGRPSYAFWREDLVPNELSFTSEGLPSIPTSQFLTDRQEVTKNGIKLGEVQAILTRSQSLTGSDESAHAGWFLAASLVAAAASLLVLYQHAVILTPLEQLSAGELPEILEADEISLLALHLEAQEARLSDLESQCLAADDSAGQANRQKSVFLADLSANLGTLAEEISGLLGDSPREDAPNSAIRSAARELLAAVDDLVDLAKLEAGTLELTPDRCEPAALFARAVADARETAAAAPWVELALSTDLPARANLDGERVCQVVRQLLLCAFHHADSAHALRLDAHPHNPQLESASLHVRLELRGCQLPSTLCQADLEALHPEVSGEHAPAQARLRLAIAKRLIEMMGGEFGALNEADSAILYFIIPLPPVAN